MFELIVMMLAVVRVRRGRRGVSAGGCGERVLMVPERDLARVAGSMDAAYLLRRVRDWVASNERLRKSAYARDGKYWCVQSYRQWVQDAEWMTERQVRAALKGLEERGLLVSMRWSAGGANAYRVDEAALAAALSGVEPVQAQITPIQKRQTVGAGRQTPIRKRQTPIRKTHVESIEESNNQSGEESSNKSSTPPARRIDDDYTQDDLVKEFGEEEAFRAMEKARQFRARHPVAYARRVAQQRGRKREAVEQVAVDPAERYVGRYADFIQH